METWSSLLPMWWAMSERIDREIASLEGIAGRMAECASRIKTKIASLGGEEGWGNVAAQGLAYACLNARITGIVKEAPLEILDGFLNGDMSFARSRVVQAIPELYSAQIKAALAPDIRALVTFLNSVDPDPAITEAGPPGCPDDGLSTLYERFLQKYAPRERSSRGVFYTPGPVARFIVRLVDSLLKEKLGFVDGLADGSVVDGSARIQVLDPAAGTGTFLFHVLDLLRKGGCPRMPRLVGIDLMPVPLAMAWMRCNMRTIDRRQPTTRTNALTLIAGNALASDPAAFKGISVVIGNPPYSRASQNKGTRVDALLDAYKEGVKGDKNIQALSDDYIKFIRLGQDIIDRNGFGILAFVVNHTFLHGPIFRGMRRSLRASFDELYVLDLHGNAKIQENVPPGTVDQNVFPIQQGTCIFVAVKVGKGGVGGPAIYHHEIYGTREDKFAWLEANGLKGIPWRKIEHPREPLLAFSPGIADDAVVEEYGAFRSIEDIFKFHSVGGKPGDDELLVSFDPETAARKIEAFVQGASRETDTGGMTEAKRKIVRHAASLRVDPSQVITYNYRPFDLRFAYFDQRAWTRPVTRAKFQCREDNLILLTTKLVKDREFNHAFVARSFTDVIFLSNTSSTNCYLFPVRFTAPDGVARWNLSGHFREYSERMGAPFDETDLPGTIGYIYAMLWSRSFKQKFGPCLKIGAPRIPFVENKAIHGKLRALGKDLVSLHLLAMEKIEHDTACSIDGAGSNAVDRMREGRLHEGRLHINPQRYFFPVRRNAYDFRVGKYVVLRKWLDDRVGKTLNSSEIHHFQAMVHAIDMSNDLVARIDGVIDR